MTTIGIDNGSTGSIGILTTEGALFESVPTQDYLHYGKKGTISKRLDRAALSHLLSPYCVPQGSVAGVTRWIGRSNVRVFIERPFTGKFINAVIPAHRFFEATIIVLEDMQLGYEVVDSGAWQAALLGGVSGSAQLKRASKLRGEQLYPALKGAIKSQGDADGLLIAHHYHRGWGLIAR